MERRHETKLCLWRLFFSQPYFLSFSTLSTPASLVRPEPFPWDTLLLVPLSSLLVRAVALFQSLNPLPSILQISRISQTVDSQGSGRPHSGPADLAGLNRTSIGLITTQSELLFCRHGILHFRTMGSSDNVNGATPALRYIPLSYSPADSQASALRLILTLNPDWEGPENKIEFVRFTDGITNTVCLSTRAKPRARLPMPFTPALLADSIVQLLKIINRKPNLTDEQIDNEAVLMRAYGNGTEILIDRESTKFQHLLP